MIKGIAFDLDGIIVDTAQFHYIAWKKVANSIGIEIDEVFNENLKGVSRSESLKLILKFGEKDISKEKFSELMNTKNNYYKELIESLSEKSLLPGIADFLKEVYLNKIPMVIASASENAPKILNSLGVDHYFDHIINPKTLKNNKPAPDIFLKAASVLNLLPQDMVGIEDAKAGITAINLANMFSVGIGDKHSLKEANLYLSDTSLLNLDIIKKAFIQKP